ncbi:hypothetical protein CEUSTIGMA_g8945.t1 [Chlamydomonas eustigma]|uniref:S-adenosylmethionine decarboxylase proenzyme n=1 Tax=Chlamydomonas eustigma TaxID=1157962 RepID=A0A250XEM5_9CHLO|nr:hypothetical protein CEUSTIGMA_g8945.t1 [Chlamydomonas eustigma]|eukprot:GAX81517.1 hypothetical protein CEUSTIGMA_g8945.t1 [Chlamydomonas eustigma]
MTAGDCVLPNPVFEGSEKRIEVDFAFSPHASSKGLRAFSKEQLDELMTLAHCEIVSSRSNAHFDAYVLSESSLFVYPTKYVLKTCGTTRLLNSVPRLLELANFIGMMPARCKYSRASFLFPEHQPFPHTSFDDEVEFLDALFNAPLASSGKAYVLGQPHEGLQWHVYVAGIARDVQPTLNIEICMTELGEKQALQFVRTENFVSAEQTTKDSGIFALKPNAIIDDYVFEPCGYSMNGIDGSGLMTIHITPEPGFSYASLELSGFESDVAKPDGLLAQALKIFSPGKISMAISVDQPLSVDSALIALASLPLGYSCISSTTQKLDCGGAISYYNIVHTEKVLPSPNSPMSVHHAASYLSVGTNASLASMTDMDGSSVGDQDLDPVMSSA